MGLAELEEQLGILIRTVMKQQKFNLENQGNNRNLRNSSCNSSFGDDLRGNDSHTKGQFKNDKDAYKVIDEMSMNRFIKKYGTVQEYFDSFSSLFSKTRFEEWCLVDIFICGCKNIMIKNSSRPLLDSSKSNESKEGVKNKVGLRDLDVSWKDGVECEEIELRVSEMDGSSKSVEVLDESCEENVEDSSEIQVNSNCLMVLDNFECDQSREREFTSFSLSQPSNDTPKILNHSLEENGNPDVKTEYDFWESTLVKMEKVSEETKTSVANSQEVGIENIGVKNYEEGGKENADVKGKENANVKEDVKCKKNEYIGLNGFNEFFCEDDEIEEIIDLGRLVYFTDMVDCVNGGEMDYIQNGRMWEKVGRYKSFNVFAYDSDVHNPSTKVVTCEDELYMIERKRKNSEMGSVILKFDIWKWPKRKKPRYTNYKSKSRRWKLKGADKGRRGCLARANLETEAGSEVQI
ncbi:hypothetical protein Tco_0846428 [Tanacetum coccineum]